MRAKSRLLRVVLAAGLLVSLLAATVAPAAAQPDPPSGDPPFVFQDPPKAFAGGGDHVIYYPWVSGGEDFGLGTSLTSISVQNLEDRDGQVWIYRGNGNNGWVYATTASLNAWASKTFTAAQLGITESGAPVAVVGFGARFEAGAQLPWTGTIPGSNATFTETVVVLSNPLGPGAGQEQVFACVANNAAGNPSPFLWMHDTYPIVDGVTYQAGSDGNTWVIWSTGNQLQELLNAVNASNTGALINPFGGTNGDGDCNDSLSYDANGVVYNNSLDIGGTAFATATAGSGDAELEQLATTHTAVSGYNAVNGSEVDTFNEWYLPIAQTNCGPGGCWDSVIRVANLASNFSAVEVRFFPADDGSGSLQTGFQLQQMVQGGETWNISLSNYVPDGWVGAVHVYSDGAVFAMVDRFKVGYNMWITNTGSAANFENRAQMTVNGATSGDYVLYAPHVLVDYFGWNTGINVANLYDGDNNVSIQYFNMLGNATQGLSKRLAAHGMTYFYDPSESGQNWSSQNPETDPNAGIVASALIWSDEPVAAVVDATKYPETDPRGGADVFQATSYNATQNAYAWQAVPYVTKGNPTDGSGATSGINFMNPNPVAATIDVYWVNPSGFDASNFGTSVVTIPAYANGFVYSLWQHNLPNGFTGAAVAISRGGTPIVAASANVNYDVEGDGAVIYNGFNSCGFYRTIGDSERWLGQVSPFEGMLCDDLDLIGGEPDSITATVLVIDGAPDLSGHEVYLYEGACEAVDLQDDPYRTGTLGGDLSEIFEDLDPGNYCVVLAELGSDFEVFPNRMQDVTVVPNSGPMVTFTLRYSGLLTVFSQGCPDADPDTWLAPTNYGSITEAPSNTDGIASPNGMSCHFLMDGNDTGNPLGPYNWMGGPRTSFGEGYVVSLQVYLDPAWDINEGFDWSVASSRQGGGHLRDFIFHILKVDDAGTPRLLVNGNNNSNHVPTPGHLPVAVSYEVTTAGWYTLQHVFRSTPSQHDATREVLTVDLVLIDPAGNALATWTRKHDPVPAGNASPDFIDTLVGGNYYGWVVFSTVDGGVPVGTLTLGLVQ